MSTENKVNQSQSKGFDCSGGIRKLDGESLKCAFQRDGFVTFPNVLSHDLVKELNQHLDDVFKGNYDRNTEPDKRPKTTSIYTNTGKKRVQQIINIHKCDSAFRKLVTNKEIARAVGILAGWTDVGVRMIQDQIWAKPAQSPPLTFHRDSPYFMFTPDDVVTVWVALDFMSEELGPLEYVKGSHLWGKGRVGTSSAFFQSKGGKDLLYDAALKEGLQPDDLEIVSMAGIEAGGISIHNGLTWHGSGKNKSLNRPRRGLGIHYIPGNAEFTAEALQSKLWRNYYDESTNGATLSSKDFPLVWKA